jgi:hypothetical protein
VSIWAFLFQNYFLKGRQIPGYIQFKSIRIQRSNIPKELIPACKNESLWDLKFLPQSKGSNFSSKLFLENWHLNFGLRSTQAPPRPSASSWRSRTPCRRRPEAATKPGTCSYRLGLPRAAFCIDRLGANFAPTLLFMPTYAQGASFARRNDFISTTKLPK